MTGINMSNLSSDFSAPRLSPLALAIRTRTSSSPDNGISAVGKSSPENQ